MENTLHNNQPMHVRGAAGIGVQSIKDYYARCLEGRAVNRCLLFGNRVTTLQDDCDDGTGGRSGFLQQLWSFGHE